MNGFIAGIGVGLVGSFTGLISTVLAKKYEARAEQAAAHGDRLREATLDLASAATRVGEGDPHAHSDVRAKFFAILLLSRETDVHTAARRLVRTTYNVAQGLQGRERRPAPAEFKGYPAAEVRASVRDLITSVRKELGISEPLGGELTD